MIFSVVIPTHKRKELLAQLLDSIELQSLNKQSFEVIVIATENDVALELDLKRWTYNLQIVEIKNDPHSGKSAAAKRNYGVQLSKYPWIAFIDDDCIASPQWLSSAKKEIETHSPQMIEGGVHIPPPKKKTLPFKGILRLSKAGGYQTCNMFYKKDDFLEVGGFDLMFPFYLEDSDLAWTMLEKGKKSVYCPEAQVSHPVPPPEPKRLLTQAIRMEKLIYLYKKHPESFKNAGKRTLSKAYKILALNDIILFLVLIISPIWSLAFIALKAILTFIYVFKIYRGLSYTSNEWTQTYFYILICPIISVIQFVRGHLLHSNIKS